MSSYWQDIFKIFDVTLDPGRLEWLIQAFQHSLCKVALQEKSPRCFLCKRDSLDNGARNISFLPVGDTNDKHN